VVTGGSGRLARAWLKHSWRRARVTVVARNPLGLLPPPISSRDHDAQAAGAADVVLRAQRQGNVDLA
jgi:hypothetical protein